MGFIWVGSYCSTCRTATSGIRYYFPSLVEGETETAKQQLGLHGNEMKEQELKRIGRFALYGGIGFGFGAIGFGAIRIAGWDFFILSGGSVPSLLGFPAMGALGGAALGVALRDWKRAVVLAAVGAVTFLVGLIVGFLTGFVFGSAGLGKGLPEAFGYSIAYAGVPGVVGGAALGLALMDLRKMVGLALAGALGFGLGMLIMCFSPLDPWSGYGLTGNLKPWLGWVLWGIIGGASLGATLGYLEERWPHRCIESN